jgi:hypothetical protein
VNADKVSLWLGKRLRTTEVQSGVLAVLFVVVSLVILFVSFWVTYGVVWFVSFSFKLPLSHHVILLIAASFMVVVVIVGARQKRDGADMLEQQVKLAEDMDITLSPWTRYGMTYDTNAMKTGAFEIRSVASAANYVLCGGVLLGFSAMDKVRLRRRLKTIDVAGCSKVLALLLATARRTPFAEIVERIPGLDPVKVFDDLRFVEGVLFLATDPAGLTLNPELREELIGLVRGD